MIGQAQQARCFNAGCDARFAGLHIGEDPYKGHDDGSSRAWRAGWLHIHAYWGHDAIQRPKPLVALQW